MLAQSRKLLPLLIESYATQMNTTEDAVPKIGKVGSGKTAVSKLQLEKKYKCIYNIRTTMPQMPRSLAQNRKDWNGLLSHKKDIYYLFILNVFAKQNFIPFLESLYNLGQIGHLLTT